MTADDDRLASSLAKFGDSELGEPDPEQRLTKFKEALRVLRDDPTETARIDSIVDAAETGSVTMNAQATQPTNEAIMTGSSDRNPGPLTAQQHGQRAGAKLTMQLLSEIPPKSVMAAIVKHARDLSGADLVKLAVPDKEAARLTVEYAEGDGADRVRGLALPTDDSVPGLVLASGVLVAVDDIASDDRTTDIIKQALPNIGPAVAFPLGVPGRVRAVLIVARHLGKPPFPPANIEMVKAFGTQAAIALELTARRKEAGQSTVAEDRDRIIRDLHDLVIQRLYATGMTLEGTIPMAGRREASDRIRHAVDAMDDTIKDIRATLIALQNRSMPDEPQLQADEPQLQGEIAELVNEMTEALGLIKSLIAV